MADERRSRPEGVVTLHLVPESVWLDQATSSHYKSEGFPDEGFIHCTDDHELLIEVGNRYYRHDTRDYVVLEIDLQQVQAPAMYEDDERRYPHVYGPIEREAVTAVRRILRAADGTFYGIGEAVKDSSA